MNPLGLLTTLLDDTSWPWTAVGLVGGVVVWSVFTRGGGSDTASPPPGEHDAVD